MLSIYPHSKHRTRTSIPGNCRSWESSMYEHEKRRLAMPFTTILLYTHKTACSLAVKMLALIKKATSTHHRDEGDSRNQQSHPEFEKERKKKKRKEKGGTLQFFRRPPFLLPQSALLGVEFSKGKQKHMRWRERECDQTPRPSAVWAVGFEQAPHGTRGDVVEKKKKPPDSIVIA
jgi:hypothetical protein